MTKDLKVSDNEIAARNPQGADESDERWIDRLKGVKAEMLVQAAIDAGELVLLPDGTLIEREPPLS
jgi:hypothetical protein